MKNTRLLSKCATIIMQLDSTPTIFSSICLFSDLFTVIANVCSLTFVLYDVLSCRVCLSICANCWHTPLHLTALGTNITNPSTNRYNLASIVLVLLA